MGPSVAMRGPRGLGPKESTDKAADPGRPGNSRWCGLENHVDHDGILKDIPGTSISSVTPSLDISDAATKIIHRYLHLKVSGIG
jgi:hypothetical protein